MFRFTVRIYRSVDALKLEHREAITPNEDWAISSHPHVSHLYVASGGSFYAWKFSPTIGKYVSQMMRGELKVGMG